MSKGHLTNVSFNTSPQLSNTSGITVASDKTDSLINIKTQFNCQSTMVYDVYYISHGID